jgi:glycosyltransferase involved in cell wall biosynthesis
VAKFKYTIFLPVKNGVTYVREAIDSVLAQTSSDWRLLVLDNASTDGTAEAVREYRHARIELHTAPAHLPIWRSWHRIHDLLERGAIECDLMTIIGHDDRLHPEFLQTIDRLITEHPTAGMYQTAYEIIDGKGQVVRPCRPIPAIEMGSEFLVARLWGLRDSCGTGSVFRAADYLKVGGFCNLPRLLHSDDLLFARLSKENYKIASPSIRFQYRLHRASASYSLTGDRVESQLAAIDGFMGSLEREFSDLVTTPWGQAALACFLAREVMMINIFPLRRLLSLEARRRLGRLVEAYSRLDGAGDYHRWLGTNVVSRELYVYAKQVLILIELGRSRLAGRSQMVHAHHSNQY